MGYALATAIRPAVREQADQDYGGFEGALRPRAERYQVAVYVDAATLGAEGESGRSELEDGTRVSAETSRRLAGDEALATLGARWKSQAHIPDAVLFGATEAAL